MESTYVCSHCGKSFASGSVVPTCPRCEKTVPLEPVTDAATLPPTPATADSPTLPPDTDVPDSRTLPPSEPGAEHSDDSSPKCASLKPGASFGDYELQGEIARGGMGVVYRARQTTLNRTVAIKMILAGQLASENDVQRFLTEAEAAAQLEHSGIVPIYDIGEVDGQHYFSMPLIEGQSLVELLRHGPLTSEHAAKCVRDVAAAVHYAHTRGIIHRDLKPANILLDKSGAPKITDFGLAKTIGEESGMTATGQVMGTAGYMPPEQASGDSEAIDRCSDIYSIGAILYCLLTGRPPFQAASQMETLMQVLERNPIPPQQLNPAISTDLQTITLKCLQKNPARRYGSAEEIADELQRVLDGRPIVARPVPAIEHVWRWCQRNKYVAALLVGLTISIIAGVVGVSVQWRRAEDALGLASVKVVELTEAEDELAHELYTSNLLRADALSMAGRNLQAESLLRDLHENPVDPDDRRAWWRLWEYYSKHPREGFLPVRGTGVEVCKSAGLVALFEGDVIHVLRLAGLDQQVEVTSPAGEVSEIAISPDGHWLVASHSSSAELCLWDLQNLGTPRILESSLGLKLTSVEEWAMKQAAGPLFMHLIGGIMLANSQLCFFSEDMFAQYDFNGLHVWSVDGTETPIDGTRAGIRVQQNRLLGVSGSSDTAWYVQGYSPNANLFEVRVEQGTASTKQLGIVEGELKAFEADAKGKVPTVKSNRVAVSNDGKLLAVIEEDQLRVWDLVSRKLVSTHSHPADAQTSLTFTHENDLLITSDRKVAVRSLDSPEFLHVFEDLPVHSEGLGIVDHAGGRKCLISERTSRVRNSKQTRIGLWPIPTPKPEADRRRSFGEIFLGPNGVHYVIGRSLRIDTQTLARIDGESVVEVPAKLRTFGTPLAVAKDVNLLVTIDSEQKLLVLDETTLETRQTSQLDIPEGQVEAAISRDGASIAVVTTAEELFLLDGTNIDQQTKIKVPAMLECRVEFSPDGRWLAVIGLSTDTEITNVTAPTEYNLLIHDTRTGERVGSEKFLRRRPVMRFSESGTHIYVAAEDLTVLSIPNLTEREQWKTSVDEIIALDEDPQRGALFCGTSNGSIAIFDTRQKHENLVLKTESSAVRQLQFESERQSLRFADGQKVYEIELEPAAKRIELNDSPVLSDRKSAE